MEYNFESDIKFLAGDKALRKSIEEITNIGCRRLMLICDEITYRVGQIDDMMRQFNKELTIVVYFKVLGDVASVQDCERALRVFKSKECDSIIVAGRKQALAVAKAVKIMLKDNISFMSNYRNCKVGNISSVRIPLVVVPTNLSSGVEASNFVRIYDIEHNDIFEFNTPFAQTNIIILDPVMTDTMPPKTIASCGLYALAMSVCSLVSGNVQPLAKVYAVTAINLLTENLKKSILQNAVKQYRFKLLLASVLAGYAYWQTPKDILSELADRISDRYRANYGNVFCILFKNYINLHQWGEELDFSSIINLIGDNEYLQVKDGEWGGEAIIQSVNGYYARTQKYVKFIDKLRDLGVQQKDFTDIASSIISMHRQENQEYTFSFINELLEASF